MSRVTDALSGECLSTRCVQWGVSLEIERASDERGAEGEDLRPRRFIFRAAINDASCGVLISLFSRFPKFTFSSFGCFLCSCVEVLYNVTRGVALYTTVYCVQHKSTQELMWFVNLTKFQKASSSTIRLHSCGRTTHQTHRTTRKKRNCNNIIKTQRNSISLLL
jgi:hypothetical protein